MTLFLKYGIRSVMQKWIGYTLSKIMFSNFFPKYLWVHPLDVLHSYYSNSILIIGQRSLLANLFHNRIQEEFSTI